MLNIHWALPHLVLDQVPQHLDYLQQLMKRGVKNHHQIKHYPTFLWRNRLTLEAKKALRLPLKQHAFWATPLHQVSSMRQTHAFFGDNLLNNQSLANEWCRALSQFFADDHWQFHAYLPHLWLVTTPTTMPRFSAGSPYDDDPFLRGFKAEGEDAKSINRAATEIQMFMHQHPLNQGFSFAVNGLWLWLESMVELPEHLSHATLVSDFFTARRLDTLPTGSAPLSLQAVYRDPTMLIDMVTRADDAATSTDIASRANGSSRDVILFDHTLMNHAVFQDESAANTLKTWDHALAGFMKIIHTKSNSSLTLYHSAGSLRLHSLRLQKSRWQRVFSFWKAV